MFLTIIGSFLRFSARLDGDCRMSHGPGVGSAFGSAVHANPGGKGHRPATGLDRMAVHDLT